MTTSSAGETVVALGAPEFAALDLSRGSGITFRRLQIFWAVSRSSSLTKAAKQLGLAQPSLSQQVSSLEAEVGATLFDRSSNRMDLTEDGAALLRLAARVLVSMQELEDGIDEIGRSGRRTLRIAGLNSVLRVLLPPTMQRLRAHGPGVDFDLHDAASAEVLELLYGRRVSVGLISTNAISPASSGFAQIPIVEDPYVAAVPEHLVLDGIVDAGAELAAGALATLNSVIQFTFGTQHTDRDQAWYDAVLPQSRTFARVRSFETGIGMVQQGLGVCLIPAMSAAVPGGLLPGLRLYHVGVPTRRIAALLPEQNRRMAIYATLLEALQEAGRAYRPPSIHPAPFCLASPDTDAGAR